MHVIDYTILHNATIYTIPHNIQYNNLYKIVCNKPNYMKYYIIVV